MKPPVSVGSRRSSDRERKLQPLGGGTETSFSRATMKSAATMRRRSSMRNRRGTRNRQTHAIGSRSARRFIAWVATTRRSACSKREPGAGGTVTTPATISATASHRKVNTPPPPSTFARHYASPDRGPTTSTTSVSRSTMRENRTRRARYGSTWPVAGPGTRYRRARSSCTSAVRPPIAPGSRRNPDSVHPTQPRLEVDVVLHPGEELLLRHGGSARNEGSWILPFRHDDRVLCPNLDALAWHLVPPALPRDRVRVEDA